MPIGDFKGRILVARMLSLGLLLAIGLVHAAEPRLPASDDNKRGEPDLAIMFGNDNRSYLAALSQIRDELERFKDDRERRASIEQLLGTGYSYVGRYQKALETFDDVLGGPNQPSQQAGIEGFEPNEAVATLLELADRHQVIMVNEAHHVPLHRAFTIQLLEGLYRKGFRYFAAETLTARDDGLHARGYPTLQSGSYLREPLYADLVRTALAIGYKVVPYEFEPGESQQGYDDLIAAQNTRETGQARNLRDRILAKDPKAKVIVHAGYAHISKKTMEWELDDKKGEVRFMAIAFQALTGIEPLSVDQTYMCERSKPKNEPSDYRTAVERGLVTNQPVILRNPTTKEFFVPTAHRGAYDLAIVHARTRYEDGRPTWMAIGGRRKAHSVKADIRPPQGSSYLVQAFLANEKGSEAIPIDQMEYGPEDPMPTLWLPIGGIQIRIVNISGKTLHEYSTN
jgi:tetratricopeptide (TPR) repeat protein